MYKTLVVASNLSEVQKVINSIAGKISTLQIVGIATNKRQMQLLEKSKNYDVILFYNTTLHDFGENVYDKIIIDTFQTPIEKYENHIYLSNQNSSEFLIMQIEEYMNKINVFNVRKQASEILVNLGFTFKHIGTKYLVDAIEYSYTHANSDSFVNLEREIYPYISRLNHKEVVNVKWSIARCINLMYLNHTTKSILYLEKYLHLEHMQKPTPKFLIGMITNQLLAKNNKKST